MSTGTGDREPGLGRLTPGGLGTDAGDGADSRRRLPAADAGSPDGGDREPARPSDERAPRPLIERLGLFLVALVMAGLFAAVALALISGGELFLGVMAALGCAMTIWVGGLTLLRG